MTPTTTHDHKSCSLALMPNEPEMEEYVFVIKRNRNVFQNSMWNVEFLLDTVKPLTKQHSN